ncbi:WhiB family transcriptional regulator [Streptomyces justiciae]|uniref:WhiB family transcriptional regulator n=1 Tax=Streptomyces justiciae TaxID=2780140 RepID=UPI001882A138|nr:WhiB family transcriptional regulator [Streptomyces justiciae]MBE8478305.1 WhiB family transcriptional regulator [Streptomyces justiciae]MCW8384428.1 WhiB family transcriptional regulator [Streptomyces justiciae]
MRNTPKNTLRPLLTDWQWQQRAACRGMSSATFFSPPGERGRARRVREERARAICGRCEVVDICAATALKQGETYGVWGGLSDDERRQLGRGTQRADSHDAASR